MKFEKLINLIQEVTVHPPIEYPEKRPVLKDDQTIRVYHGFNDLSNAILAVKYGLSGKERVGRIYSYENNNNPTGLFVTLNFKTAKYFGPYIIEIHTKVSDLESPVWPGGSYTVQGQMSQYFSDENDRENARMLERENAKKSKYAAIKNSDRPELASSLFMSGETAALFIGELDPNSIKRIWVSKNPKSTLSDYERLTRKEFIEKFKKEYDEATGSYNTPKDISYRLFKPREKFSIPVFMERLKKDDKYLSKQTNDEIISDIKKYLKKHQMLRYVWPNQLDDAWEQINQYNP